MSVSVISHNLKTGTCPHGLPLGACPICNGMGGAKRVEQKPVSNKSVGTEWSWMKCYIEGKVMQGRENRKLEALQLMNQMTLAQKMTVNVNTFIQNVQNILNNMKANLPIQLQGIFGKVTNAIIAPLLNLIAKLPVIIEKIEKFISNIKAEIANVMEKLTALLGELKNFIKDKLQKQFKKVAKKFLKLFMWGANEENFENEEDIEIFKSRELKKVKNAILHLKREKEDDNTGD